MKLILFVFLLLSGCVVAADSVVRGTDCVIVVYSDFDIVASSGIFGISALKDSYPTRKFFDPDRTDALMKIIESRKIGGSTAHERRQMKGPIYFAIYEAQESGKLLFISDGCYLLNYQSKDIFEFGPELADFMGITSGVYVDRLCAKPGLGIKLSPR
ncbi:MAG: hypothetical protein ABL934_05590 [Lysobacteraceae bacterium]